MEAGTIDAYAIYAEGYYNACYQYQPTALHLTILPAGNNKVTVQYYMKVDGKVKQGSYTTTPDWYTTDGDTYQYNTNYTFDLATALPASNALQMTKVLGHTNTTEMSYFVGGIISNMRNTPEEIVQYKSARFDISDDGASHDQLYCENVKWLSNSNFTNGNEIALGDEVVIFGSMQCGEGSIPTINGHVYSHNGQTSAGIEDIILVNGSAIFDIMGRRVSTNNLTTGVYVLRTGDKTKKIYINKQ
jgi:hypothetical protein